MKKKIIAIMLGLTLTFSSVSVFAKEAETETETETENAAITAGIALLEAAAGTGLDLYGEIVIINDDGTLVVNTGDLIEDEEDASLATLELTEVYIQFTVSDDVSSGQLANMLTVTTLEVQTEEETDPADETEDSAEEDAEEETESTGDEDAEAESETEETVETEAFDVSDFQVGDIIHFTINGSFEIDTVTLISTKSDASESNASETAGTEASTENDDTSETADTEEEE